MEEINNDNFIHFADGTSALFLNQKMIKNNNKYYWQFKIRPGNLILNRYPNLKKEIKNKFIIKSYKKSDVKFVDNYANHIRIWIFANIEGKSIKLNR